MQIYPSLRLRSRTATFTGAALGAVTALMLALAMPLDSHASGRTTGPIPTGPHEVPSTVCAECHAEIYQEWSQSMHAKSTALNDPIHGAFYRSEVGDPTLEGQKMANGQYPVCLNCHAPNAALQKTTKLDAKPAYREGVNCVFCHTITDYKGVERPEGGLRLGVAAYEISTTSLQASSGINYTTSAPPEKPTATTQPFHPFPLESRNATLYKSNQFCLGCHEKRNNPHGVPLCATGPEITASGSETTCQACHMPIVNGHASHAMMGGHDHATVRRAVKMTLKITPEGDALQAKISLQNTLPHNFPTGAPFRIAVLRLTAYDADGNIVWQNSKSHPSQDDPKAAFMYVLKGEDGKPAMPPVARGVLRDTRLGPHETRHLEYKLPASGVQVVRAELHYNLLNPPVTQRINSVLTDELKAPRIAAIAEVRL
jgi:nitrate/TMAO reductase-like tetraheme cytochrome c subunit